MSFKIAVIGCGWVAQFGHGPCYQKYAEQHPDVQLAACCDVNAETAAAFAKQFGFEKVYTDPDELLAKEEPDVMCLNVPEAYTAELAVKILKLKIPLFMEKPPGASLAETQKIAQAADASKTVHGVAFNRRFMPIISGFQNILSDKLGLENVQYAEYQLFRVNRRDDHFSETAIHGIDLMQHVLDSSYHELNFTCQPLHEFGEQIKNIYLAGTLESGVHVHQSYCPMSGVVMERMLVTGENVTCFVDLPVWDSIDFPGKITVIEGNQYKNEIAPVVSRKDFSKSEVFGFYPENRQFFNAVRNQESFGSDIHSFLQTMEISDCIRNKKDVYTV